MTAAAPPNLISKTWARPVEFPEAIPTSADVVIIGGGIIGVSTAWFLAQQGIHAVVCEKGHIAGEGVFVPRPDSKTEDDGWLIGLTHDQVEERSELRVMDCRDLTADPIARVQIPQRVPYGFHGLWLPSEVV